MKSILDLLRKIKRAFRTLYWRPYIHAYSKKAAIFFESSTDYRGHKIKKSNWGDDLNYFFFNEICKEEFVSIPYNRLIGKRETHYLLIGSVLTFFNLDKSIVYGSGIQYPTHPIKGTPEKILAVRGPKTREVLLQKGYECPERYGDLAILLPCFYKPDIRMEERHVISLIPNEGTLREKKDSLVKDILKKHDCRIINMSCYSDWKEVIDLICESKLVISESLHGLIVAETYGVPSIWVEFIEHPVDWNFKFLDFYESIGKYNMESIKLYQNFDWDEIIAALQSFQPSKIDREKLLSVFPFEIKKEFKNKMTTK